jgi:predicted ATPase/class 3 adenylate cyclase
VAELPRGTVTFLFTDIEGSTRLLDELGAEKYGNALAEHRRALREAFDRHGGVEVDTQGDAFFVAFPTAPGALEAAREAQEELELPVRMGLHTGTPLLTEEGYVGADVHRAARIASAGHGRQVLVSAATAALVDSAGLRDLGEHRLKDLSAPERIFQLSDGEFPPLKTLYRTNLPIPATPFLGREHELADVRALLERDDARLLTLTGAGGSGKTRLALHAAGEAAEAYPDGVWWVPLAPLADPADVGPAAARALGGGGSLPELVDGRRLLLVLDNFEHVVEAAPEVAAVLTECPHADVLVTSRERLRVQGEHVYPVPVLERAEARRLFVARARAVEPSFEPDELLDDLCTRLDDLPLAIELAAARTSLLSTAQLLERLGSRLDLLRGGRDAEARQQTLRATIEWSYELLEPDERTFLTALSVFRGGWTIEAAERVCEADLDLLQSLVDKSLIRRWESGRFGMLETIREFAAEQLEQAGEAEPARRRHADYFLELAEDAGLCVEGLEAGKGEKAFRVVLPERDNLRAAFDFFVDTDEIEAAARLAVSLEQYWVTNSPAEGARLLRDLCERGAELPPELRVRAIRSLAGCIYIQGEFDEGARLSEEALGMYRELGEDWGIAHMLLRAAVDASRLGDNARARNLLEESLSLWKSQFNEAQVTLQLGTITFGEGRLEEALELVDRAARLAHEIDFVWWETNALETGAEIALNLERTDHARERATSGVALAHSIGDRQGIVYGLGLLAWAAADAGEADRAGRLWGAIEAEAMRGRIGQWEAERDDYATHVFRVTGADFDRGLEGGRRMALDDAVAYALGART